MDTDNLFTATLASCHRGETLNRASDQLRKLVAACEHTEKKGTLTLKVQVIPRGAGQAEVSVSIKSNAPEPTLGAALFFIDDEANLTRHDPNQQELPFEKSAKTEDDDNRKHSSQ